MDRHIIARAPWEPDSWTPLDMESDPDLGRNEINTVDDMIMTRLAGLGSASKAKLAPVMSFQVMRCFDQCMDQVLRVSLLSPEHADSVLDVLGMASLELTVGGAPILKLQRLALDYIVGTELNRGITLLSTDDMRDVNRSPFDEPFKKQGQAWVYNTQFKHLQKGRYYLDIPLHVDFFMCGCPVVGLWLQYHDVRFTLTLSPELCSALQPCLHPDDALELYSNAGTYCASEERRDLACATRDTVVMSCSSEILPLDPYCKLAVQGSANCKFFIIMMKYTVDDSGLDGLMPSVTSATLHYGRGSTQRSLDPDMFFVRDYKRNIRFYVISPDPEVDMTKWCLVQSEFNEKVRIKQDNDQYTFINQGHMLYRPVAVDQLTATLDAWPVGVQIEGYCVTQSIMRNMSGMAGLF